MNKILENLARIILKKQKDTLDKKVYLFYNWVREYERKEEKTYECDGRCDCSEAS